VNNPKSLSRIAYVPDELYQPSGFNMMDMAKKYALLYPHFNYDRFAELTSAFELDPRKSFGSLKKGLLRQSLTVQGSARSALSFRSHEMLQTTVEAS
jgi:ABC-2 type transport system ATP-binding protein